MALIRERGESHCSRAQMHKDKLPPSQLLEKAGWLAEGLSLSAALPLFHGPNGSPAQLESPSGSFRINTSVLQLMWCLHNCHQYKNSLFQYFIRVEEWPRGLRHRPAAARLLRFGFESHRGHGCLSVVSVMCCQVEVSATGWSLVQRSPNDCGASLCVI